MVLSGTHQQRQQVGALMLMFKLVCLCSLFPPTAGNVANTPHVPAPKPAPSLFLMQAQQHGAARVTHMAPTVTGKCTGEPDRVTADRHAAPHPASPDNQVQAGDAATSAGEVLPHSSIK